MNRGLLLNGLLTGLVVAGLSVTACSDDSSGTPGTTVAAPTVTVTLVTYSSFPTEGTALNDALAEFTADLVSGVVEHWASHLTWLRPPILVTGDVTGSGFEFELLVGFTRLGNLLGLLDRQEVPEMKRHRVWVGAQSGRVG